MLMVCMLDMQHSRHDLRPLHDWSGQPVPWLTVLISSPAGPQVCAVASSKCCVLWTLLNHMCQCVQPGPQHVMAQLINVLADHHNEQQLAAPHMTP